MHLLQESGYAKIDDSPTIKRYIFTFCKTSKYFHRKKKQRLDSKTLDNHCINGSVHGSSRHQYHRRSPGSTISRRNRLRSIVENGDSEYGHESNG